MKKMFKAAAVLAAAMMVMGFVSCSDSDDSDDTVLPAQASGGEASSGGSSSDGSGTSSGGSETPAETIDITAFDGETMIALTDMPSSVTRIDTNSKQAVDANAKTLNGKNFSYRFKFGGKDPNHNANALKIAVGTTSAVKIVVYGMSSSKDVTGQIMAYGSSEVKLLENAGASLLASEEVSVTPDSDGNIFVYATTQAMNIYYLKISQ